MIACVMSLLGCYYAVYPFMWRRTQATRVVFHASLDLLHRVVGRSIRGTVVAVAFGRISPNRSNMPAQALPRRDSGVVQMPGFADYFANHFADYFAD
jgi:hypothetical protein